ncbi:MAG: hypothetical protein O2854_06955 [Chloroflexi bacterium]|nr:hypothetical protein [Chloroflexota bacterium]
MVARIMTRRRLNNDTTHLEAVPHRIYLINVGANATHPFCSPIFDDGRFEFLPIPETPDLRGKHAVRYGDLRSFYEPTESLEQYLPQRWHSVATHSDPEFESFTYGDNCEVNARAASLKRVEHGDYLFFIASLCEWEKGAPTHRHAFYLVGFLEVESVLANVRSRPDDATMARFGGNAHIRRGLTNAKHWDGFWIFGGSLNSRRFERAVPITRGIADRLFTSADGSPWRWDGGRTEMQVIGSYTRSCRCVLDPSRDGHAERIRLLWDWVERWQNQSAWITWPAATSRTPHRVPPSA